MSQVLWRLARLIAIGGMVLLQPLWASATLVQQFLTNLGGSTWLAGFTVVNDGTVPAIESFTVYLDGGQATMLVATASPAGWDSLVVQPDGVLSADGFFDALLVDPSAALTPGVQLGGFSVQFDWSGTGTPVLFAFTVNNPDTFEVLESGQAVAAPGQPNLVPEPATWALLLVALGAIGAARQSRSR